MSKLRELFEGYPGGMRMLSVDSGVSYTSIRRFRDGWFSGLPWAMARKLAAGKKWQHAQEMRVQPEERARLLIEMFRKTRADRDRKRFGNKKRRLPRGKK